jgi:hypothetical protein
MNYVVAGNSAIRLGSRAVDVRLLDAAERVTLRRWSSSVNKAASVDRSGSWARGEASRPCGKLFDKQQRRTLQIALQRLDELRGLLAVDHPVVER